VSSHPSNHPRSQRSPRRVRLLVLASGLAALAVLARAMLAGSPPAPAEHVGGFVLAAFALLLLGSLLQRLRQLWHTRLRSLLVRAGAALWGWTGKVWPRGEVEDGGRPPLGTGDRIALVAGLLLCALDVALTTLLLRDVFPEPPYRFELMGWLSPEAAEWSFYVVVALFKTLLELWFGVFDKIRSAVAGPSAMRWFVLGGASAFDAALAAARGMLLAEQGMGGSAVTVSNIVFVGFGVAVPWVAAHTGGLLVAGMDGFLARLGLLRWLANLPRMLLLLALWLAVVAISLPIGAALLGFGLLALVWFSLDDVVATILGHEDDDTTPALPVELIQISQGEPPRDPPLALPRTAGGVL
jgi:hypothetical protein